MGNPWRKHTITYKHHVTLYDNHVREDIQGTKHTCSEV
jgi:hypothetical protein